MTTTAQTGSRDWQGVTVPAPGTFVIDPAHTRVGFVAKHLMVTKVRGAFGEVAGSFTVPENPLEASAQATMKAASLSTGSPDRDAHLHSGDFLDEANYPDVSYRSTGVSGVSGDRFKVQGELTIRDVTRPVELDVEVDGVAGDPWGGERVSLTARGEIDREEFGLTWNVALESGGVLVSKKVVLEIDAQGVREI
ncbi:MAG: YceI family protein [Jiangellales bacterium]